MGSRPKGFTHEQDCLMCVYTELAECDWVSKLKLPKGITKKKAEAWLHHNGYRPDPDAKIGWSKPTIRRDQGAE